MSASASSTDSRPLSGKASPGFFKWFPWEKLTIWALVLLLVYVLRDFFAVIFLTFIFSYMMTNLVRKTLDLSSLRGKKGEILAHRVLTCIYFVVFILAIWGVAVFLKHPFETQIRRLVSQFQDFRPQTFVENLVRETVGTWQFNQVYTDDEEGEAQKAADLEEFRNKRYGQMAYDRFSEFRGYIDEQFKATFTSGAGASRINQLREEEDRYLEALHVWVRDVYSPSSYAEKKAKWSEAFEKYYTSEYGRVGFSKLAENEPNLEQDRRTWAIAQITPEIFEKLKSMPDAPSDFVEYLGDNEFEQLRGNRELYDEKLREFYEDKEQIRTRPASFPKYGWERFKELSTAVAISPVRFYETLEALFSEMNPEDREKVVVENFERQRKTELARKILESWNLEVQTISEKLTGFVPEVTRQAGGAGIYLFNFVVQFMLSLLLSFFITFDLPRIKKGLRLLQESRARDFYLEIAPGLEAFGVLIGRAFQAQGVIAICNTLLTFALIKGLDIRFETFLCTIVFICSFIPVLGVILSSIPIAVIAFQYNDLLTAVYAIAGILIIHFIETSILNPKILGEMLHLHPVLVLGILVVGEHFFKVWGLLLGVPVMVYIIHYVILGHDITKVLGGKAPVGVGAMATGPPHVAVKQDTGKTEEGSAGGENKPVAIASPDERE